MPHIQICLIVVFLSLAPGGCKVTVELTGDVVVEKPASKHVTVGITDDGRFVPNYPDLNAGDAVTYIADIETKLCIDKAAVFGETEYMIAAGASLTLPVARSVPPLVSNASVPRKRNWLQLCVPHGFDRRGGGRQGGWWRLRTGLVNTGRLAKSITYWKRID
jgi:hypothetical protein